MRNTQLVYKMSNHCLQHFELFELLKVVYSTGIDELLLCLLYMAKPFAMFIPNNSSTLYFI